MKLAFSEHISVLAAGGCDQVLKSAGGEKTQVNQRVNRCTSQYADIIDLPHHVSKRHPQMALDRAAQFGSREYDAAVKETIKKSIQQTEAYIEMEQYDD